jgi:hypothetical protein
MIVTPAKAGVQFKFAWIPAFAGMTNRPESLYVEILIGIFLEY